MGTVLAHPAARSLGGLWIGGLCVLTLPAPPDRPELELSAVVDLSARLGSDALVVLMCAAGMAQHQADLGWHVTGSVPDVQAWTGWGEKRSAAALRDLESAGVIERQQLVRVLPDGQVRRGRGILLLRPDRPSTTRTVSTTRSAGAAPRTQDPAPALPAAVAGSSRVQGSWGDALQAGAIIAVMSAWGYDDPAAALGEYGQARVSDAVKMVAYKSTTQSPPRSPGGYLRTTLASGQVAAPPPGVDPSWLAGDLPVQLLAPAPVSAEQTRALAQQAQDKRERYLSSLRDSLCEQDRSQIDALVEDDMRAFFHEPAELQRMRYLVLLEERLAAAGLLLPPQTLKT